MVANLLSAQALQRPRTGKQFSTCWAVPNDLDTLVKGDPEREAPERRIPNMYHRQDRLVGDVLDACVILHVYEQLKAKSRVAALSPFFKGKLEAQEIRTLEEGTDGERLNLLIALASEERNDKRLATHRVLVGKAQWDRYVKTHDKWLASKEAAFEATQLVEKANEKGAALDTETLAALLERARHFPAKPDEPKFIAIDKAVRAALAHVEAARHKGGVLDAKKMEALLKPLRDFPERPDDPRVTTINQEISQTIQLLNPGPKDPRAIEGKGQRKQATPSEIRDVNRIGVLPTRPEYARDFITIMRRLTEEKYARRDEAGAKPPRFFEELPEVLANGYYNQKLFLALDRDHTAEGLLSGGRATIAEIKIVPAKMFWAEKVTDKLKPLIEELELPSKYTSAIKSSTREQVEIDRIRLRQKFEDGKKRYEESLVKHLPAGLARKKEYVFPTFPDAAESNKPEAYINLRDQLLNLSTTLHVDAILAETEWQKEYLTRAVFQRLCMDSTNFRNDMEGVLPQDIHYSKNKHRLGNSWMAKIAESGDWDIALIEKKLKGQKNQLVWQRDLPEGQGGPGTKRGR